MLSLLRRWGGGGGVGFLDPMLGSTFAILVEYLNPTARFKLSALLAALGEPSPLKSFLFSALSGLEFGLMLLPFVLI